MFTPINFPLDSTMVFGMGASSVPQERCGMYSAPTSGRHVGGAACRRGDGRRSGTGSRLQHPVRGLHVAENYSQVSFDLLPGDRFN